MKIAEIFVPAAVRGAFQVKEPTGSHPHVFVRDDGRAVAPQAGSVLLDESARMASLDQAISAALAL